MVLNPIILRWESGSREGGPKNTRFTVYTPPSNPISLSVSTTTGARGQGGPRTIANPAKGSGNSFLFLIVAPGPGESASGSYTPPHPNAVQMLDYAGDPTFTFIPRLRLYRLDENGQDSYTFGWSDTADVQNCLLIAYNSVVDDYDISSLNIGVAVDEEYPTLSGITADHSILAFGIQQSKDQLTAGPAGYTQLYNDTEGSPLGITLFSGGSTGTSETPGNPTWNGTQSAKLNFVVGVSNGVTGGNSPLPDSAWTVLLDPEQPNTWDESRPDGQLIVAGNRFQQGATTDDINFGSGYGLSWISDEISSSLVMEDSHGQVVLGARTVTGLNNTTTALKSAAQWINGNGYDSDAETGFPNDPGGQPSGVNMSTDFTGSFATHRTYFDGGPRCQYSMIPINAADPKAMKASFNTNNADEVIMTSIWQVKDWMRDGADAIIDVGMHAPAGGPASPFTIFANYLGQYQIITRDLRSPWTSGTPPTNTRYTRTIEASDVGNWWASVVRFKQDPIIGWFEFWLNTGTGFNKVIDIPNGTGWGWAYAEGNPDNDLFYALMGPRIYCYHRYTNNLLNNWDDTYGNVREVDMGKSGLIINPNVTVQEVINDRDYYILG